MKPADTTLTKADTRALWHAIQWMEDVLRNWRRDGFTDGSRPQYDEQRELLLQAKRALRKANAIRKAGASQQPMRQGVLELQQGAGETAFNGGATA